MIARPAACQAVLDDLSELSLGVLPGRRRASALAHVDTCDRCRTELEQLTMAADGVLRAAPYRQPPPGFEERVLARMTRQVAAPPRRRAAGRRSPVRLAAAASVVALVVVASVALTGGGSGHPGRVRPPSGASAALVSDGHVDGRVTTYAAHGRHPPWLSMTIHDRSATGLVHCQVVVTGGAVVSVGTFWVVHGSGHWDAKLPVPAGRVTGARLVDARSAVLASAQFGG